MNDTDFNIEFKRSLIEELRNITSELKRMNQNYEYTHGITKSEVREINEEEFH